MENLRTYGSPPFTITVLHGGPGAPGSVAPVARELSDEWGVLEPLQTRDSIEGQVEELHAVLEGRAQLPVALVGHSWGAMLGFLFAARYPAMVRKLILVGSGVFTEEYAQRIEPTRMARMSAEQQAQEQTLVEALGDPTVQDKDSIMAQWGAAFDSVDTYDPIAPDTDTFNISYAIHTCVWHEAQAIRVRGDLLAAGRQIVCPVVAIHGDYDPHPADGIREPLASTLNDFRFVLLDRCGHSPWRERQARETFYRLLRNELRT